MPPKKVNLKLIPKDRRENLRASVKSNQASLKGTIGHQNIEDAAILSIDFGQITLGIPKASHFDLFSPKAGAELEISLRLNDTLFITGSWNFQSVRTDAEQLILSLEHPKRILINDLSPYISSDHLLRADFLKVLTTMSKSDVKELSGLFTELVDFGKKIKCKVHSKNKISEGCFNFESKQKNLSELLIETPEQDWEINKTVIIEFDFLTVHYLFTASIKEIDGDFGFTVIGFPDVIAAVTSRRFHRNEIDIKTLLELSSKRKLQVKISSVSTSGCEILFSADELPKVGESVKVDLPDSEISIDGCIKSVRSQTLGVSFTKIHEQLLAIRELYNLSFQYPYVLRSEKEYGDFLDLYRRVGYGPTEVKKLDAWSAKNTAAWTAQDTILHGNTVGVYGDDKLMSSFGIIPISEKAAGTHSLAMEKNVVSIGTFIELINHNLSNVDLIPYVKYYFGSVRLSSRFSTRLYTVFEMHSRPTTQELFYCLSIAPGDQETAIPKSKFNIEEVETFTVPEQATHFFSVLENPHYLFEDMQKYRHYRVTDKNGKEVALIKALETSFYFSAAGVFRACWCFINSYDLDTKELFNALLSDTFLSTCYIELFLPDVKTVPKKIDIDRKQDDVFYFLFDKDEMAPLVANMHRAAWKVLRKYGSSANEYLERLTQ